MSYSLTKVENRMGEPGARPSPWLIDLVVAALASIWESLMARAVVAQPRKKFIRDGQKLEDWGTVTVADALADRQRVFRCLECRAPVRPHKASADQDAHFEHRREFAGCPWSAAWDGTRRENAAAVA